ncbi:MFS transporter [Lactobacillus nasalidis]|uniref:MFS transporter n=1 Tax=Lactobacillus nasalidis TaxID=2797258 RepID=A0ABQ3W3N5_9LACO|nr:MFS transporter [Lactobacillus nasalidis]GHW01043.1 MFS transporter [Lactobacillus nasalidis]
MSEKKAVKERGIFKVSLLSISLFLMMAPQISSALPLMYKAFPGVSKAGVESLATVPNFGIMLGLILSPVLIRWLGEKTTIILGLLLTLLAGTFPMYASQYGPILVSRFLIGLGIGLFNSLAVSLIPQFYNSNEEMATMIGYQNVMGSVGAAISSFLISYLVTISWHAAFAIYFLVIPSLILFALFVPLPKKQAAKAGGEKKTKQHINGKVCLIAGLMFLIFLFYMPMSYKLPTLIVEEHLGSSSTPALVAGISTLISIPIGASFGFFFKKLHDKVFPVGFAIITLGFVITAFASSLAVLFAGVIVIGFGFGMGVPYMYNWLDWAAPEGSVNLATTIVLILVNLGCSVSPTVVDALSGLMGSSSSRTAMLVSTIFFALMTIYAFVHYFKVHRVAVKAE